MVPFKVFQIGHEFHGNVPRTRGTHQGRRRCRDGGGESMRGQGGMSTPSS